MSRRLLAVIAFCTMVCISQSVLLGWTVQRVTNGGFNGSFCVDGDKLVYVANGEVFQYDGHQSVQISSTGGNAFECSTSSGLIVWNAWDGHDYEMFLHQGGTTRQLTDNEAQDVKPDMSGSDVVWGTYTYEGMKVMLYDGSTTRQLGSGIEPRVSSGRVAWVGWKEGSPPVHLYDGNVVTQLAGSEGYNILSLSVSDRCVAWNTVDSNSQNGFGMVHLNDGQSTIELGRGFDPQLCGSKVVFATEFGPSGVELNTLALWDGSSIRQVPGTQGYLNLSPAFCGDGIAWFRLDMNESAETPIQIRFYDGMSATSECIADTAISIDMLAEYVSRLATGEELIDIIDASPSMICWYGSNNDLYAAVIPEPSSLSLTGIALLAIGRIRNRIRKS